MSWITSFNWYLNELTSLGNTTRLVVVIGVASISLLFYIIYSGLLHRVCIKTGRTPYLKLTVAYKFGLGDSRVAHKSLVEYQDLMAELPRFTITYNGSIYKRTAMKKESYAIGIVVSVNDRAVWIKHIDTLRMHGFGFAELPGIDHAVLSKFPYCNYLSVFLAAYKVLPKMRSFIKEKRLCAHPFLEIMDGKVMDFVVPLSMQFDYYVPEAKKYYKMLNLTEQIVIRATPEPPTALPLRISKKQRMSSVASSVSSSTSGISSASQSTSSDTM